MKLILFHAYHYYCVEQVIKVESTDDEIDLLTVKKPTRLVNCLVGDETACIRFVARREQGTDPP